MVARSNQIGYARTDTGCEHSGGTGYTELVGIHESLKATPQIRKAILRERNNQEVLGISMQQGFYNLRYDSFKKALRGLTSPEEIIRSTSFAGRRLQ